MRIFFNFWDFFPFLYFFPLFIYFLYVCFLKNNYPREKIYERERRKGFKREKISKKNPKKK